MECGAETTRWMECCDDCGGDEVPARCRLTPGHDGPHVDFGWMWEDDDD